ncbi:MAG: hypothetical protein WBW81_05810 [Methylocella sp.]
MIEGTTDMRKSPDLIVLSMEPGDGFDREAKPLPFSGVQQSGTPPCGQWWARKIGKSSITLRPKFKQIAGVTSAQHKEAVGGVSAGQAI